MDTDYTLDLRLPMDVQAPGEARRALHELDSRDLPPDALHTVRLLASELVTNAVKHAAREGTDWVQLTARLSPGVLRIEVVNPGPGFEPEIESRPSDVESGRGLFLVDNLADRWGVHVNDETRVWAEIDLPASSP